MGNVGAHLFNDGHYFCGAGGNRPDGSDEALTNGIVPEAYLRHILSVLPEWPSSRVDELLLHISMEVFGECRTTYSL
ncbi:TPA: transposase domain-containing protein [Escherichia coli]|nr:transposase domain-containing protein [Escherichia coli]EFJ2446859.1 transposase domain-containing protein [Escherichia coli]HAH3289092.1 hypothetical protein [Escherichia coli]HAX1971839.1 transposase domain-containing protein [Escherichia coli]HAX1987158.1 transposase domain-containing protein [Escherichia coli]